MDPVFLICLLILGSAVGFAAGMLGIGGGMLMVPFLTMLFTWQKMPLDLVVHAAIATSMTSILFTSISSVWAHHRKGAVRWKIVAMMTPGIIFGGLFAGGAVFKALNTAWLSLAFALFVGYSATNMLRSRKPQAARQMPGVAGSSAAGAGIGFISGLVGAGGGFLSVPFMTWCNVALHNAVATSAALGFPIALANSAGYIFAGLSETGSQPGMLGYIYLPALAALLVSVLTAPFGAKVAHQLPVATLKKVFAFLLFALAAYMLYKAVVAFSLGV